MGLLHFVRNDVVVGQGRGGNKRVIIRLTAKETLLRRFYEYLNHSRKARKICEGAALCTPAKGLKTLWNPKYEGDNTRSRQGSAGSAPA